MAKIIKFALELKDGESARTIEDLREHFDLEKIVAYFMNGRLLTWLKHRHLDEEAAALEKLSADDAKKKKIAALPNDLASAVKAAKASDFIKSILPEVTLKAFGL